MAYLDVIVKVGFHFFFFFALCCGLWNGVRCFTTVLEQLSSRPHEK